jgi:hypothetical protein
VVVCLVVSRCYVELDKCVLVCTVCVCGGGRPSATASIPFAVGILL